MEEQLELTRQIQGLQADLLEAQKENGRLSGEIARLNGELENVQNGSSESSETIAQLNAEIARLKNEATVSTIKQKALSQGVTEEQYETLAAVMDFSKVEEFDFSMFAKKEEKQEEEQEEDKTIIEDEDDEEDILKLYGFIKS